MLELERQLQDETKARKEAQASSEATNQRVQELEQELLQERDQARHDQSDLGDREAQLQRELSDTKGQLEQANALVELALAVQVRWTDPH